jgi:Fur family ferric uptake transcriptional regulator
MGIVRKTKSVELLLAIFNETSTAISVVELVKETTEFMNKSTVYRILERLEGEGVLHSFISRNGIKWYAKCSGCSFGVHSDSHPHFQCKECGGIECLSIDLAIPSIPNVQIDSAEIMLIGICKNCIVV